MTRFLGSYPNIPLEDFKKLSGEELYYEIQRDRAHMNNFFKQQNADLGEYDKIVLFSFCGVLIVMGVVCIVSLILL
jgi:hypothetical protein